MQVCLYQHIKDYGDKKIKNNISATCFHVLKCETKEYNFNVQLLYVVSRCREPQFQVTENYLICLNLVTT